MPLQQESLTGRNLGEVVDFVRSSNPFAQHTWGWDAGRFMDWRWGVNTLWEASAPGWFSEHCRIFRDGAAIRAVAIAEYGEADTCILTASADAAAVAEVAAWVVARHGELGVGIGFEFSDQAEWLRTICRDLGLTETARTGHEWEFRLDDLALPLPVQDGFTIESRATVGAADHEAIAACVREAFGSEYDVAAALRNLESNPMFRPELSVVARSPDRRVAAYCRGTVDPDSGVCGIDPVCCRPEFQRLGLARAVVEACFAAQRRLGGLFCYIGSGPEPAPGTFLYKSLHPSGRTVACRWSDGDGR